MAINIAPADERMFDYPSKVALIIVNELEAMALSSKSSPQLAFDSLIKAYPEIDIVLTLGEEGVWSYRAKDSARKGMGSFKIDATDETAAGDSFIGYLMATLVAGRDLHESITLASAAGALATTKAGAVDSIPSLDAVRTPCRRSRSRRMDLSKFVRRSLSQYKFMLVIRQISFNACASDKTLIVFIPSSLAGFKLIPKSSM